MMKQCICKMCGKVFLSGKAETYYCPECMTKAIKSNVLRDRVCTVCGAHYMGYPRSKYCPDCRIKIKREREKKYKKAGAKRPLGSIDICQKCGKEYVVTSGLQKYCADCAPEAVRETIRAHKRDMAKVYNREVRPKRRKSMREGLTVCAVCGKAFTAKTSTVTCSPECTREYKRQKQAISDYKRGRSKPDRILAPKSSTIPQSGIKGITWHRKSQKWQLKIDGKYIGLFPTIEEAAARKSYIEEQ